MSNTSFLSVGFQDTQSGTNVVVTPPNFLPNGQTMQRRDPYSGSDIAFCIHYHVFHGLLRNLR